MARQIHLVSSPRPIIAVSDVKALLRSICPPIIWEILKHIGRRRPKNEKINILEERHRFINSNVGEGRIALRQGLELGIHPASRHAFEYFCFRSPAMVRELDAFLRAVVEKQRFLDIGALHGIFSLAFASQGTGRRVLAIEASPIAFARLLYNVHKNKFQNIEPVECAVSDVNGVLRMHYEWEHLVAANTLSDTNSIEVPVKSGDHLCRDRRFCPDVIKIDVEGHEIKVLKGLWETLENDRPLIFLELHPTRIREEGDSFGFLKRLFHELSYSCVSIEGSTFTPQQMLSISSGERLIFIPEGR